MVLLETKDVTKQFGALAALDGIDYTLEEGEVASIIGPNGAGKTTFFNVLTGEFEPTNGQVILKDEDITDLSPHERVHKGMARVFQISNLFPTLSVFEHIRLGRQAMAGTQRDWLRNADADEEVNAQTEQLLQDLDLLDLSSVEAASLSHGDQRKLEIGMALSLDPDVLLLDEPTSGLPNSEVNDVIEFIKEVSSDFSVMIVEHKMNVVIELSDRISVLHRGKLLADGSVSEVRNNERVQEVYFGNGDINA